MAAKKKTRLAPSSFAVPPNLPPEDRRAEAATVAWMLCALFTLCAEGVGVAARLALSYSAVANTWALLADITMVMGLVTGTVGLILAAVVYKLRKTPPPTVITVVAVLLGLTPWLRVISGYLR